MYTETTILDFINYDCLSNDVTAAYLKQRSSIRETLGQIEMASEADLQSRDRMTEQYEQTKKFLSYA